MPDPRLERQERDGIACWTDPRLLGERGIVVAFSERRGGVSDGPYSSLNLAQHVGDDPARVDENRTRLLRALALGDVRERLVIAEQVHGDSVTVVSDDSAGAGALAARRRPGPVRETDALATRTTGLPLLLFFADCVPLILVSRDPRGVSVVHAGWRGAAARVHVAALDALCSLAGTKPADVDAYIGPHIGPCHYQVGSDVLSRFAHTSVTISAASGPLDLGAVVSADLERTGVRKERIATLPSSCTAEHPDRFYSYRSERVTGRHGALAIVLEGGR
jgi:YfiH family protein